MYLTSFIKIGILVSFLAHSKVEKQKLTCVNIRQAKFELILGCLLIDLGQSNFARVCGLSSSLRQSKNNGRRYITFGIIPILKHDSKIGINRYNSESSIPTAIIFALS